jgi:YesN/AraC family two-component response regulator
VLAENEAIDVVFTDVVMPGTADGFDLVQQSAMLRPGLRFLLTSGFSGSSDREHRLQALGCRLLSKPYRHVDLAHAIREVLDRPPPLTVSA